MGTKVTLSPVTVEDNSSYENELNNKLEQLADEFDNVVYRDGSFDANGNINMGSHRFLNVGAPVAMTDVLRLQDLADFNNIGVIETAPDFVQQGTGAVTREQVDRGLDVISVLDYIPVVQHAAIRARTSTYDCTANINTALAAVALLGGVLVFPRGLYNVANNYLFVYDGIKGIRGEGAEIKVTAGMAAFRLTGINGGRASNVKNMFITGLDFNGNGMPTYGIFGQNVSGVKITKCRFFNMDGAGNIGVRLHTYSNGTEGTNNNIIAFCEYQSTNHLGNAFEFGTDLNYGAYVDAITYWKGTRAAAPAYHTPLNNLIAHNRIDGGYYGVSISAAFGTRILGNVMRNNKRHVTAQNGCQVTAVHNNILQEGPETGIQMAYGCLFMSIKGNTIYSTTASGQGMIIAYAGCDDIDIHENILIAAGAADPNFFVYAGVHCDRVSIKGNKCYGGVANAGICLETAWLTSGGSTTGLAHNGPADQNLYSNTGMGSAVIEGNEFFMTVAKPAIALLQQTDANGTHTLSDVRIKNNVYWTDTPNYALMFYEATSGGISDITLEDNEFYKSSSAAKFLLPRGREHFLKMDGNQVIDLHQAPVALTPGDTTPSVAIGRKFALGAGGAVSITDFDDGMDGLEIEIQGDSGTTLVHNNALMRLKGNVNIAPWGGNAFVRLRRIGGIWYETGRSF